MLNDDARQLLQEIDEIVVYDLPMNIRFRGLTSREGILLHGTSGWAEAAPFWDYAPAEAATWLASGIALATTDWPQPVRTQIPVNVTIPACDPLEAQRRINQQPGCATAKVKVAEKGQVGQEDMERVETVAEELRRRYGSQARVRVDANAAWSVAEAALHLDRLDEAAAAVGGLEYAEQPVSTTAELADLRARTKVPIAADESIRRADNPLEVRDRNAADVAVLKVAPLGGIRSALQIAADLGLPAVVSSALDTSIGIASGIGLAGALPSLDYACGLNTATMFVSDVVGEPLIASEGFLDVEQANAIRTGPLTSKSGPVASSTVDAWIDRLNLMCTSLAKNVVAN